MFILFYSIVIALGILSPLWGIDSSASTDSPISESSTIQNNNPTLLKKYDGRLRRFGIYQAYANNEILTKAKGHHVFRGDEDSVIELRLPSKCEHFGWFYDNNYIHGQITLNDGMTTVSSGSILPSSTHCTLLYSPEPDYYGEILFWFTIDTNKVETASSTGKSNQHHLELQIGTIIITPTRDPPVAIDDDQSTATAGQWIYIPVLVNDEDVDVTSSPICYSSEPVKTTFTSPNYLQIRVIIPNRMLSSSLNAGLPWTEESLKSKSNENPTEKSNSPPNPYFDHPIALITVNADNNINTLSEPVQCKLGTNLTANQNLPVKDLISCNILIPISPKVQLIQSVMVTILPNIAPGTASSSNSKPFVYDLILFLVIVQ